MTLDSRKFSQETYKALIALKEGDRDSKRDTKLEPKHCQKATGIIQGLPTYISTWGLHRLTGDMKKFLAGTAEDTKYKGKVYKEFLYRLKAMSGVDFDPEKEESLINLQPLRRYVTLNHLAIKLAKEWSFWAPSILGEAEE